MTLARIDAIEQELRTAVSSGAFHEVPGVLDTYCKCLEEQCRQLPAGSSELPELRDRFMAISRWMRMMISTARSQSVVDLQRANLVHGYLAGIPEESPAASFDL